MYRQVTVPQVRVLIADDHAIFREGLRLLLKRMAGAGILLAGEAADGVALLELQQQEVADIVLMDIQMPRLDGIRATKALLFETPGLGVIALSSFGDGGSVGEMAAAGARGYLLKSTDAPELSAAILLVAAGGTYYSPSVDIPLHCRKSSPSPALSERERDVVRLLCQGTTSKDIGLALGISYRTVEGHRQSIMSKIRARHSSDMIAFAIRNRLQ